MTALRDSASKFTALNTAILFIVPHETFRVKWWQDRYGSKAGKTIVPVLCDAAFQMSADYGVAFQMRIHTDTSNTPGAFLIDKDGTLKWKYVGKGRRNWADRPKVEALLEQCKKINP